MPLNRQVGGPKTRGPASGKQGNLLVLVHMFLCALVKNRDLKRSDGDKHCRQKFVRHAYGAWLEPAMMDGWMYRASLLCQLSRMRVLIELLQL